MMEGFRKNTARYIDLFSQVADELIPKRQAAINPDDVDLALFRSLDISLRTS
jgi:hypothetical protein